MVVDLCTSGQGSIMVIKPSWLSCTKTSMSSPVCTSSGDTYGSIICKETLRKKLTLPAWQCTDPLSSANPTILETGGNWTVALASIFTRLEPDRACMECSGQGSSEETHQANKSTRAEGCTCPGMGGFQPKRPQQTNWISIPRRTDAVIQARGGLYPLLRVLIFHTQTVKSK